MLILCVSHKRHAGNKKKPYKWRLRAPRDQTQPARHAAFQNGPGTGAATVNDFDSAFFTSKHRLYFWKYSYCAPEQWPQSIKWIKWSIISEPVSMVWLRSFLEFLFCSSLFLLLFSNYAGAFESICRSTAHKHMSFMHEVSKNTSSCHIIISLLHTLREQRHFTPRAARTECRYVWEVLTASSQHIIWEPLFSHDFQKLLRDWSEIWSGCGGLPQRSTEDRTTKCPEETRAKLPAQT